MPSVLSHPAVPLGVAVALGSARVPPRLTAVACVASVLPDIDVLGFMAGVPYHDFLGHRGLTHSLLFALVVAAVAALAARRLGSGPLATLGFVFLAAASHGFLDAATNGGLGVAFLAPFSAARYFLPWRVIEVSPIGVAPFFSEWGLRVLRSELLWVWAPSALVGLTGLLVRRATAVPAGSR